MSSVPDISADQPDSAWLHAFLTDPPVEGWSYAQHDGEGHELRWHGCPVGAAGPVRVAFRVRFTGRTYEGHPDWRYGLGWAQSRAGARVAEVDVDEARELHGTLLPVVQQHWVAMLDAEAEPRAS